MGKAFDGCYNVFAWINNAFWGTLCIIVGVYALFWEQNLWFGVLGIGVGIYFFWTESWTRKTIALIAGEDPDEAPAPAAQPIAAYAPPGSVSQRKTIIKRAFVFASLMFLLLGSRRLNLDGDGIGAYTVVYGGLSLVCFFVYARITVHRPTEDAMPALPWGDMFVAVLTAAFSPNARRVSYTTQEGAVAAVDGKPVAADFGLSGKTKMLLIAAVAGVVLIVGGLTMANIVRAAWDHKLEGDYARQEADGIAQAEADAQAEHEALEADTDSGGGSVAESDGNPTGPEASEGETPRDSMAQIADLFAGAPQDGSGDSVTRKVFYLPSDSVMGESVAFSTDDPYFRDPYSIGVGELTTCYVGDEKVSTTQFLENVVGGMYHTGTITYTDDTIFEIRIVME